MTDFLGVLLEWLRTAMKAGLTNRERYINIYIQRYDYANNRQNYASISFYENALAVFCMSIARDSPIEMWRGGNCVYI